MANGTLESVVSTSPDSAPLLFEEEKLAQYIEHTLGVIRRARVNEQPFFHLFIEQIFPQELYVALKSRMLSYRRAGLLADRGQDNPGYINRRYNLQDNTDAETRYVRALFSDRDIQRALIAKFYIETEPVLDGLRIHHEEFEFVYTAPNRFQNIHIDIPPKFMSFVFYFPESRLTETRLSP